MKKQDYSKEYEQIVDNTKYVKVHLNDEMKRSFISYAMAVNVSRAIPDVRDGLKPVHRRILYSMGELNLSNDKPFRKCAVLLVTFWVNTTHTATVLFMKLLLGLPKTFL